MPTLGFLTSQVEESPKLTFRPVDPSDCQWVADLRYDSDVYSNLHDATLFSVEQTADWIRSMDGTSQRYVILSSANPIGLFRVDRLNYREKHCYVGLDIVKEYRGKGLAKPAYRLVLDYLFNNLGLEFTYLEVLSGNTRARQLYDKLGFVDGWTWPHTVYNRGEQTSTIMYMSRSKFNGS